MKYIIIVSDQFGALEKINVESILIPRVGETLSLCKSMFDLPHADIFKWSEFKVIKVHYRFDWLQPENDECQIYITQIK